MSIINTLRKLDRSTKAEVYLVGGFVRDFLRGVENDDVDIVIRNYRYGQIIEFLRKRNVSVKKVYLQDGTYILLAKTTGDSRPAQISLPKRGLKMKTDPNNTLRQDAVQRDLRVNAMYLPINFKSREDVIDLVGGESDIKNRILRSVGSPDKRIKQSPVRMLRVISLAARTGYNIDPELGNSIKRSSKLLKKVPVENVREEFNKVLLSHRPSKYLKIMRKLDVLSVVLPEIDRCYGITQEKKYHKHDVFHHCAYTCDFIEPDIILRLSALLHDVGKSQARRIKKRRITFHRHEVYSANITKSLLSRLKYKNEIIGAVVGLVRHHMYYYDASWTDLAIKRFIKKANINDSNIDDLDNLPLFKLRAAERLGNGFKVIAVPKLQRTFQERVETVYRRMNVRSVKDLTVSGDILINTFNLKQGPVVGEILNYLLSRVEESDEHNCNNKRTLLRWALNYIENM